MDSKQEIRWNWLLCGRTLEHFQIWAPHGCALVFEAPTLIYIAKDQSLLKIESKIFNSNDQSKLVYVGPGSPVIVGPTSSQPITVLCLTVHSDMWHSPGSLDVTAESPEVVTFLQENPVRPMSPSLLEETVIRRIHNKVQETLQPVSQKLAQKVLAQICENQKTSISIGRIAINLVSHPSLVSRAFSKEYGISPVRYSHLFRLAQAKKSLRCGARSLHVSREFLFSDQSHFVRSFRSQYGMTPRDYQIFCGQTEKINFSTLQSTPEVSPE